MAISWGPITESSTNGARVGVDLTVTRSGGTLTRKLELWIWTKRASYASSARYRRSGNVWSDSNPGRNFSYSHSNNSSDWPTSNRTRIGSWTSTRSISPGQSITTTAGGMIASLGGNIPSGPSNGWIVHSRSVTVTRPANPPSKPSAPTASNITPKGFTMTVSAPASNGASITSYHWQRSTSTSFSNPAGSVTTSGRSFTWTTLNRATSYWIRVRARNSAGWGSWSSARKVTTAAEAPGAPGRPSLSDITSSSIRQTSSAAASNGSSIIEYQHQRSTSSSFSSGNLTFTTSGRTANRTGLKRYTTYYFRARARNSIGWGPWSSSRSGRTLAEVPVVGTVPNASRITRNSAYFTGWTAADNGGQSPSNLRLQYNTSQSTSGASVVTRGSWNALTLTGLQADTRYYYRGAIYNSAGWSSYSAWKSFTTLDDAPDDMGTPSFSNVTDTEFTATWTAPDMNGAEFSTYEYEVALNDSFSPVLRRATRSVPNTTQSNLTPGTRYYIRMRAVATPNNGGWGEGATLTTGFAPESGLRAYAFINGVRRQGELYTFVDGEPRRIRPMYAHDGKVETE